MNCSFILRTILEVRRDFQLEINWFSFDYPLSRAHNKYKGQQGHMFFLTGSLVDSTNLLMLNNVFQIPYNFKGKDQRVSRLAKDLPSFCWNDLAELRPFRFWRQRKIETESLFSTSLPNRFSFQY